jgi:hypothetical protein
MAPVPAPGQHQKGVVMNHQQMQATTESAVPRLGIAIGFAMLASAAIVFNVAAAMPQPAQAPVAGAAPFAYQWTEAVDWERVAPARITPAETVGAYER